MYCCRKTEQISPRLPLWFIVDFEEVFVGIKRGAVAGSGAINSYENILQE
jgi:hypothetical protein